MSENVKRKPKRTALANITNLKNGLRNFVHSSKPISLVPCSRKISKKKESSTITKLPADLPPKNPDVLGPCIDPPFRGIAQPAEKFTTSPALAPAPAPASGETVPNSMILEHGKVDALLRGSDSSSGSVAEIMSICDSLSSPEYKFFCGSSLNVPDSVNGGGVPIDYGGFDGRNDNPQYCSAFSFEIYNNLRKAEAQKRPSIDFMEKVQTDINASMRAILIDWLVDVAEDYKLAPDTLFLTVNYIDRYLSRNWIDRKRLQLLGIACMMIAAKFEEIKAPEVDEFCYITDYTYCHEEALEMESIVLKHLKFEMSAPTTKCFLRHLVCVAQQYQQVQSLKFECLANYLAELSLPDYTMLRFAPSMIAASAIFLAKFILSPRNKPWDSTLKNYTLYRPFHLSDCVKALHSLHCSTSDSQLHAIREKYSQHKYKFVAKQYCPSSIPQDFFQDLCS